MPVVAMPLGQKGMSRGQVIDCYELYVSQLHAGCVAAHVLSSPPRLKRLDSGLEGTLRPAWGAKPGRSVYVRDK